MLLISAPLKIAIMNQLIDDGIINIKLPDLPSEKERMDYITGYSLTENDLLKITTLFLDGGNDLYLYIDPDWDGEDDRFTITSLEGIGFLKNLEQIEDTGILCPDHPEELLQLPSLKSVELNGLWSIDDPELCRRFEEKGVQLSALSAEQPELTEANSFDELFEDARSKMDNNQPEEALKIFQSLQNLEPDNPELLLETAFAYDALGQNTEAESYYRKCLDADPDNIEALYALTDLLIEKEEWLPALHSINQAIDLGASGWPEAWHLRGQIRDRLSQSREAEENFKKALELYLKTLEDGEDAEICFQIACIHVQLHQKDEAFPFLKKSIKLDPSNRERVTHDRDLKILNDDPELIRLLKAPAQDN